MSILGKRVRERRLELGLTQRQLAEMIGAKQPTIYSIEKGETANPRLLPALSTALKISLAWLKGEVWARKEDASAGQTPGNVFPSGHGAPIEPLPIIGRAEARATQATPGWDTARYIWTLLPHDPRFPVLSRERKLIEVKGDDFSEQYPAGSLLICLAYELLKPQWPAAGDHCVAYHWQGESKVEVSANEIREDDAMLILRARSKTGGDRTFYIDGFANGAGEAMPDLIAPDAPKPTRKQPKPWPRWAIPWRVVGAVIPR